VAKKSQISFGLFPKIKKGQKLQNGLRKAKLATLVESCACWNFCDFQWQMSHQGSRVALLRFRISEIIPKQPLCKVCQQDEF